MIPPPTKLSLANALSSAHETRALKIGKGILPQCAQVFREQFGNQPAIIVADENTWKVAGQTVNGAFKASGYQVLEPFIFRDADLYAESSFVAKLEAALQSHSAIPVAVGSGTINDLTKLVAHRLGRTYMCGATAASMDGYTAFGASITHEGLKQTFFCPAPMAVVADLDVICNAPGLMNSWGYADLVAKVTAGADWIVADALGAEAIETQAWNIVQGRLREMISDAPGVLSRTPEAIERLVEGLMLGGFAMQSAQSSRPASGAEHQFSHLWDMQHHTHNGAAPSHGFKVGIATLAVTALYERLFELPLDQVDVERCVATWPELDDWAKRARTLLGEGELSDSAIKEIQAKHCTREQLLEQLTTLRKCWRELREQLRSQLLPLATLRQLLREVGAPTEPEQIGISRERLRDSYWQAWCVRRRFTVLDLAARTGVLDDCLKEIFGSGGVWPLKS